MALEPEILDRPSAEGARIVALALISEACERARRIGDPGDAEALHDFRVSVRRLRSSLRTWRDVLGRAVRDKDLRRLRKIARATADARDAEVLVAWIDRTAKDLPASLRPAAAWLARRHSRRTRDVELAASGERFVAACVPLSRRLERRRRPRSPEAFSAAVAARVREQAARVASRLARVETLVDATHAHRARIDEKRLRYLLEPLRDVPGVGAEHAVAALRRLQDLLGALNDAVLALEAVGAARLEAERDTRGRRLRPGLVALEFQAASRAAAAFARVRAEVLPRRGSALLEPALAVAETLEARAAQRP
jgi:CHAD domain-containing protein